MHGSIKYPDKINLTKFYFLFLNFKALRREHSELCDQSNNAENRKTGVKLLDLFWAGTYNLFSEQRLKIFNFFVVLSSVISGATLTIAKEPPNLSYASPLGFLLAFFAFIFWKLDQRNKELIKHGENALKEIELYSKSNGESTLWVNLFLSEEKNTSDKRGSSNKLLRFFYCSYSKCFNWVFLVFGIGWVTNGNICLAKKLYLIIHLSCYVKNINYDPFCLK